MFIQHIILAIFSCTYQKLLKLILWKFDEVLTETILLSSF